MEGTDRRSLMGELLEDEAPDPKARDVTPGWITRHRERIRRGRDVAQALIVAVPPPARLALTAATIAADGLVLVEDLRRGVLDGRAARGQAGRLLIEAVALLAATRFAPAIIARHKARVAAARSVARCSRGRRSAVR